MKHPNLYAMWLEAHSREALPPEWAFAANFLTWATQNGYRAEYGYQGRFSPENCIAAIPRRADADDMEGRMKLDALKKLALNMGLEIGQARTKREIAELIASSEAYTPPDADPPEKGRGGE